MTQLAPIVIAFVVLGLLKERLGPITYPVMGCLITAYIAYSYVQS